VDHLQTNRLEARFHLNVARIDYFESLATNPATTRVGFGEGQVVVEMNSIDFARALAATSY